MVQPLVSVIIPTYNAEKWIRDTVNSALGQTYAPLEVIVVDDASTDGTLKTLEGSDPRVRLFRNEKNLGVGGSRNRAMKEARGEYIAFLDHDDLWHPEKLKLQLPLFEKNPAPGLVFSDCFYLNPGGKQYRAFEFSLPARGSAFQSLIEENFIPCLTAVIPKKVLNAVGSFREDLKISEDYELFLRIARQYPIEYVAEALATYRVHDRNFSHRRDIYHQELISIWKTYSPEIPLHGEIALQYVWLARIQLGKYQRLKGLRSLTHALILGASHPGDLRRALGKAWDQRAKFRRLRRNAASLP